MNSGTESTTLVFLMLQYWMRNVAATVSVADTWDGSHHLCLSPRSCKTQDIQPHNGNGAYVDNSNLIMSLCSLSSWTRD